MKRRDKIALILTGGSSAATFEVGVLKELFKKVEPDFFIATSAGAATIGGILSNMGTKIKDLTEGAQVAEKVWKSLAAKEKINTNGRDWGVDKNIFSLNLKMILGPVFASSLFKMDNYEEFIRDLVGQKNIEDLPKKLYIGTINLTSGKTVFFDKGDLAQIILASCAAVPFYPPYKIGDDYYIDGGLDIGSCIKKAKDIGADKIIIVNSKNQAPLANNMFSILRKTANIILEQHLDHYIDNGFKDSILQISPPDRIGADFHDLSAMDKLVKLGEETAKDFLKNNRSLYGN